jgi:poly-gamma-glutamate synthesis protein (capsule biosynthesis protein)
LNTGEKSVGLTVIGDIMLGSLARSGEEPTSTKSRLWSPLDGTDLILCNLECPVTSAAIARQDKQYNFYSHLDSLDVFDDRFVLGLANNHVMDFGAQGLRETIEALDARGLLHAGAGLTIGEAMKPVVLELNDSRIGVICAADPRYQPATSSTPGTFPALPELLKEAIQELGSCSDTILVSLHMGMEYTSCPTPLMERTADMCLEEGANVVAFHHAHCISGTTTDRRGTILWGTGNYFFPPDQALVFRPWFDSAVWRIELPVADKRPERLETVPVVLDNDGFPHRATGKHERRILRSISRWSSRMKSGRLAGAWRFFSLLQPSYLRACLPAYLDIARRKGPTEVLRSLSATIKTQFRPGSL